MDLKTVMQKSQLPGIALNFSSFIIQYSIRLFYRKLVGFEISRVFSAVIWRMILRIFRITYNF
jgi:hypothetical protein